MATRQSAAMVLTSSAFAEGHGIPMRYTCDADDRSPPLAWSGAPRETRSFALVCRDPDAPSGVFYHWAVFDIPAGFKALAEHHGPAPAPLREAINDFGRRGYGGPCPPAGHGRHRYRFKLYALGIERLELPATIRCREVEKAAEAHALAAAELIGTYSRM